jgi:gliding motility-associated protein GldM
VYTNKSGKVVTDTKFSFKAPRINKFKDQADLNEQIKKSMGDQNVHIDDRDAILEIYRGLTKEERMDVDEMKGVHWIGKTFDHSPSVAAVASLSSLQKDILAARASAIATIRSRVGGGEFSFNKIIPLAYGPEVVNANEDFTVEVLMAAYDSDKKPEVIYNGQTVEDVRDGKGFIKLKGTGSSMQLSGTVSIINKTGAKKTMPWTKTVTVMKPQGSIEMPQFNILYRGYNNQVNATASGYATTVLTPSNATVTRSGEGYFVRPGSGRSATLTVSGRTADGKTVQLKRVEYKVVNLPNPALYLGSARDGGTVVSSRLLRAQFPPEIPLNAKYEVLSWACSSSDMKTGPLKGKGGNISGADMVIKAAKKGALITFFVKVKGPDNVIRNVTGAWTKG